MRCKWKKMTLSLQHFSVQPLPHLCSCQILLLLHLQWFWKPSFLSEPDWKTFESGSGTEHNVFHNYCILVHLCGSAFLSELSSQLKSFPAVSDQVSSFLKSLNQFLLLLVFLSSPTSHTQLCPRVPAQPIYIKASMVDISSTALPAQPPNCL